MDGGLWVFKNAPVVIQEYDGFSDVKGYKLNKLLLWARVKGLPNGPTRRREWAEKI